MIGVTIESFTDLRIVLAGDAKRQPIALAVSPECIHHATKFFKRIQPWDRPNEYAHALELIEDRRLKGAVTVPLFTMDEVCNRLATRPEVPGTMP